MANKPQYKVRVSERARQMLADHVLFMAQISPAAARRVKKDLIYAIRSLEQMPERFPFLTAEFIPINKYHKMYITKWYLVLYQVKDRTVYVDYIIDCRQDYSWLIN